jgi:hypothetical protein
MQARGEKKRKQKRFRCGATTPEENKTRENAMQMSIGQKEAQVECVDAVTGECSCGVSAAASGSNLERQRAHRQYRSEQPPVNAVRLKASAEHFTARSPVNATEYSRTSVAEKVAGATTDS